jgi:3-oxoacyl-[acyl-carrier-protein] synthase-3
LKVAGALIGDGAENVLLVAAEAYSKILNPKDITTYPYFGDGAAALLVSRQGKYRLGDFVLGSDGSGADIIQVAAGGSRLPFAKAEREKDKYFQMQGAKVFSFAVGKGTELINAFKQKFNIIPDNIIVHQANINIVKKIAENTQIPIGRFKINVDRIGNTAGASIPIALDELLSESEPGGILLVAFGGGLSWGSAFLERNG